MICPVCASEVPLDRPNCPACGTVLTEYKQVYHQADALFNDALAKMKRKRWSEAATLLCRAAGFRPGDVEILRLWAHAALAGGQSGDAVRILMDAMELDHSPDLEDQYKEALAACELSSSSPDALLRNLFAKQNAQMEADRQRMDAALDRLESIGLKGTAAWMPPEGAPAKPPKAPDLQAPESDPSAEPSMLQKEKPQYTLDMLSGDVPGGTGKA